MDADDGKRPRMGVVVTLMDLGDGTSRLVMDDVSSADLTRDTSWKHVWFFTHKRLSSKDTEDMTFSNEEYQGIGESLIARLVALNGQVK
jgi:hypothetical protein